MLSSSIRSLIPSTAIFSEDELRALLRLIDKAPRLAGGGFDPLPIIQIVNALQHANPNQKVITIPEGYPLKFQADFVEKAWPGMGKLAADAIASRDYPIVTATTLVASIVVVGGSVLADLLYAAADPRVRLEGRE